MLRVPSNFQVTLARGVTATCAQVVSWLLAGDRRWEVRSAGKGSEGQRWHAWAQAATASPQRRLLIRRHLRTGELAYHHCDVPEGQPAGMTRLLSLRRAALAGGRGLRVRQGLLRPRSAAGPPVPRDRPACGPGHGRLAVCAVTAVLLKRHTGSQAPPPARPGQPPPADPGMIPLTVPEVRRLLAATPLPPSPGHVIHWSGWTRRWSPVPIAKVMPPSSFTRTGRTGHPFARIGAGAGMPDRGGPPVIAQPSHDRPATWPPQDPARCVRGTAAIVRRREAQSARC